jgi:pre-rRNA-processing protein TSR1
MFPSMEVEPTVLVEPDASDADSLVSSNDPDDLGNEQTWPTEEEMQGRDNVPLSADGALPEATTGTTPKTVKRIPKGMSEYQAAWIIDEDDDENDEGADADDGSEAEMQEVEDEEMVDMPVHDDGEEMDLESRKSVAFQDLDAEEEEKQYAIYWNYQRQDALMHGLQTRDVAYS